MTTVKEKVKVIPKKIRFRIYKKYLDFLESDKGHHILSYPYYTSYYTYHLDKREGFCHNIHTLLIEMGNIQFRSTIYHLEEQFPELLKYRPEPMDNKSYNSSNYWTARWQDRRDWLKEILTEEENKKGKK